MKILIIVGVVVMVLLAAAGGLAAAGFVASQGAVAEAETALTGVGKNTVDLDKQLNGVKAPDFSGFNSSNPDFDAATQALDGYAAKLSTAKQSVESDQAKLRSAGTRLNTQAHSPLTLPFRARMTSEQARVENATQALDAADSLLGIAANQFHALGALLDGLGAVYAVETKLGQQDVSGALALLPSAATKLAAAQQAAQGPGMPPQLSAVATTTQKMVSDFQSFLQAYRGNDAAAEQRLLTALEDDARALQSFNTGQIDSYEQSLAQPYIDRYERGMKAAGVTNAG